jgi:phosphate:Na+ symporter
VETIRQETVPDMAEVDRIEDEIDNDEKTLRKRHIGRLNAGVCSPAASVIFIDILSNLERIGDHSRNLVLGVSDVVRLQQGGVNRGRN